MNKPIDPLIQYESQIKEIFTLDKLPAIFAFLNQFRPTYGEWIKEDQFKTIVHISKIEAMDELQKSITQWTVNNSQLPKNAKIQKD